MLKFLGAFAIALACFLGLVFTAAALFVATTPRPDNIRGCLTTEMYHVHLCPKDDNYVRLQNISQNVRNAVIVSEDGAFYSHHGFDWDEMQKSFEKDLDEGGFARGGSTLTQQLAKNIYLSSEKSVFRKAREAIITMQLEKTLSKDEILEKYLNVVEFGDHLYGVKPAAQFYFQKQAADLSPAEGAFLAFLLPNPKKYSQSFRQKKLTKFAGRQVRVIVERLYSFKRISDVEHAEALDEISRLFGSDYQRNGVGEPVDEAPLTDDQGRLAYPAGLEPVTTDE